MALTVADRESILNRMANKRAADVLALLDALCNRAYWSRLWVVQEMMLGRKLIIRYKSLQVDWEVLLILLENTFKHKLLPSWVEPPVQDDLTGDEKPSTVSVLRMLRLGLAYTDPLARPRHQPLRMRMWTVGGASRQVVLPLARMGVMLSQRSLLQRKAGNRSMQLSTAISSFALHHCSLTHDKIFGLLGLTNANIPVEYTVSLSELYTQALIEGLLELELFQGPDRPLKEEEPILYIVALILGLDLVYGLRHHPNTVVITSNVMHHLGWSVRPVHAAKSFMEQAASLDTRTKIYVKMFLNMDQHISISVFLPMAVAYVSGVLKCCRATGFVPAPRLERKRYTAWEAYTQTSYRRLLECKLSGLTQYESISNKIAELCSAQATSNAEVDTLIKAMADYPTARGCAELHVHALQQVLQCLQSCTKPSSADSARLCQDVDKDGMLLRFYEKLAAAVQPRAVWGFSGVPDVMERAKALVNEIEELLTNVSNSGDESLAALKRAASKHCASGSQLVVER